jgi:hypothetical protein
MSASVLNLELTAPPARRGVMPRLVSAELLKLRRRRGLVVLSALLCIAPMVIGYGVLAVLHATDPSSHGPAGGISNFGGSLGLLSLLSVIAAMLIGTTSGAGDLSAGVFRELVATGRSRTSLYLARIPAGLALVAALTLAGFAVAAVSSIVFAGSLAAPGAGLLVRSGAWVLLYAAFGFTTGLGLASLIGSRAATISGLLAFELAISPLLRAVGFLGSSRDALPLDAFGRIVPGGLGMKHPVAMSLTASVSVIALWFVVPLVLGAWRTITRDA